MVGICRPFCPESPIRRSGYSCPMRRWSGIAIVCMVLAACSPSVTQSPSTTITPTSTSTTVPGDVDPCMSGDLAFDSDGLIAALGESVSDATRIDQIRWDDHATCERLTVSFTTDRGAPAATLGVTGVTVLAFAGLVRITLPDEIVNSAVADMVMDGDVAGRAYVVSDVAGKLLIDIHGSPEIPVAARAFTTSSPATLVIDLIKDSGATPPAGVATSDSAVVVAPSTGPALYPFTIEAYSAPATRSARIQLEREDIVSVDQTVSLPARPDTWQLVTVRIDDGPSGTTTLFVGQVDANDRPLDGAIATLDLP